VTGRAEPEDLFGKIHMSKISRLFNWGVGAFQIVMKNKIVSTGCFLIPGITHLFKPIGSKKTSPGIVILIIQGTLQFCRFLFTF
jgi:hypothetical protein